VTKIVMVLQGTLFSGARRRRLTPLISAAYMLLPSDTQRGFSVYQTAP